MDRDRELCTKALSRRRADLVMENLALRQQVTLIMLNDNLLRFGGAG